jgi:RecA/RadA recombinase
MRIINFFGGPGSGKSTLRAGLFYEMKMLHMNVEESPEYAKDVTYEGRFNILLDQVYMLAKQNRRLSRLEGVVDYVITDSPILLCCAYADPNLAYNQTFQQLTSELFHSYENINIFINKNHQYTEVGRNQTESEADILSDKIKNLLIDLQIDFAEFNSDCVSPQKMLDYVLTKITEDE